MNPYEPITQGEFADLIGVSERMVRYMVAEGVLRHGQSFRDWNRLAFENLRESAAGRPDVYMQEKLRDLEVRRKRNEVELWKTLGDYAPIAAIEQVLASIGRGVAGHLEPLPGDIHKLCPDLTPEALVKVQKAIATACDLAVSASMALLNEPDEEAADGDELFPSTDLDDDDAA